MSLSQELLSLERTLWCGGVEEYRKITDAKCLLAFTQMGEVLKREKVALSVRNSPRWTEVELAEEGLLQPTEDVALITYLATANRDDKDRERYRARVSSGYVKREGAWKLMFHQQTPLDEEG